MKYADSWTHVETITVSGTTTYSDWMDISWANELYSFLTFAESATGTTETVDATLERYVPYVTPTVATVLTHAQIGAAGNSEVYGSWMTDTAAPGAENKLGMRVRWKFISAGTFSTGQILTITMTLYAKRN